MIIQTSTWAITFPTVSTVDRSRHRSRWQRASRAYQLNFARSDSHERESRINIQGSAHLLPACIPSEDLPVAGRLHFPRHCSSSLSSSCGSTCRPASSRTSSPLSSTSSLRADLSSGDDRCRCPTIDRRTCLFVLGKPRGDRWHFYNFPTTTARWSPLLSFSTLFGFSAQSARGSRQQL